MLKIEKTSDGSQAIVRLIGRIRADDLAEVARQLEPNYPDVALQLEEVTLVDVDVVRFLKRCETEGVQLVNCSPYIREWIVRERETPNKK